MTITPRWERINARVWDQHFTRSMPLYPWREISGEVREDLSIDTLTVTLSEGHPAMVMLRAHKTIPVPVTVTINGYVISGLVTSLVQKSGGEITVTISSDDKHLHRILARSHEASAADMDAAPISGPVGGLVVRLVADGAQRTGLPVYILNEHAGDVVRVEVRSEDSIADVLGPVLESSDTWVNVRMLLPGDTLPGAGRIIRVQGGMESQWEEQHLKAGDWPQATRDERLVREVVAPATVPLPHMSWADTGGLDYMGHPRAEVMAGVCWVPFMTSTGRGVWNDFTSDDVRAATYTEFEAHVRPGWWEHVTMWDTWVGASDLLLLDSACKAGAVVTLNGDVFPDGDAARRWAGDRPIYAWFNGARWVVADKEGFTAEDKRRTTTTIQYQTPGVLIHIHGGRDRRSIVFSTRRGAGLEGWETTTTAPEAARIIAGGQIDAATMNAITAGAVAPKVTTTEGITTPTVPGFEAGESVEITSQPLATSTGNNTAFTRMGGQVAISAAGAFFYREQYVSLEGSATDPVGDVARQWAKSQGSTQVTFTPGHATNAVFGADIPDGDGVFPGGLMGWVPGDRVSFQDGETRVSEVIIGFTLHQSWDKPLEVLPILGRADSGVIAGLARRITGAEKLATRALHRVPPRVEKSSVVKLVRSETDGIGELIERAEAAVANGRAHDAEATRLLEQSRSQLNTAVARLDQVEKLLDASDAKLAENKALAEIVKGIRAGVEKTGKEIDAQLAQARLLNDEAKTASAEAASHDASAKEALAGTRELHDQVATLLEDTARNVKESRESLAESRRLSEAAERSKIDAANGAEKARVMAEQAEATLEKVAGKSAEVDKALVEVRDLKDKAGQAVTDAGGVLEQAKAAARATGADKDAVSALYRQVVDKHQSILSLHGEMLAVQADINRKQQDILEAHEQAIKVTARAVKALAGSQAAMAGTLAYLQESLEAAQRAIDAANSAIESNREAIRRLDEIQRMHEKAIRELSAMTTELQKAQVKLAETNATILTTQENLKKTDDQLKQSDALIQKQVDNNTVAQETTNRAVRALGGSVGAMAGSLAYLQETQENTQRTARDALDATAANTESLRIQEDVNAKALAVAKDAESVATGVRAIALAAKYAADVNAWAMCIVKLSEPRRLMRNCDGLRIFAPEDAKSYFSVDKSGEVSIRGAWTGVLTVTVLYLDGRCEARQAWVQRGMNQKRAVEGGHLHIIESPSLSYPAWSDGEHQSITITGYINTLPDGTVPEMPKMPKELQQ